IQRVLKCGFIIFDLDTSQCIRDLPYKVFILAAVGQERFHGSTLSANFRDVRRRLSVSKDIITGSSCLVSSYASQLDAAVRSCSWPLPQRAGLLAMLGQQALDQPGQRALI